MDSDCFFQKVAYNLKANGPGFNLGVRINNFGGNLIIKI
jgi:hypothetical protein